MPGSSGGLPSHSFPVELVQAVASALSSKSLSEVGWPTIPGRLAEPLPREGLDPMAPRTPLGSEAFPGWSAGNRGNQQATGLRISRCRRGRCWGVGARLQEPTGAIRLGLALTMDSRCYLQMRLHTQSSPRCTDKREKERHSSRGSKHIALPTHAASSALRINSS